NETQTARLRTFERIFGFHPLQDVRDVTLWGSSDIPEKGLLIIDAQFEREVLTDLIRSAKEFKEYRRGGQTLYTWFDDRTQKTNYGAFQGSNHILVSDHEDYVIKGLAVLNGRSEAMTGLNIRSDLSKPWVLAYADMQSMPRSPKSPVFEDASTGYYELGTAGDRLISRLEVKMAGEESAINVEKMAVGLLAFAKLSHDEKPVKAYIVDHTAVERDASSIAVYMDAPVKETMKMILNWGE
ncbi:MAG: hypothetical protein ACPGSB_12295, partial [Opitutales bacterium]